MPKLYVKMPGNPIGFTSREAAVGAIKEYEVEEIQSIMLYGEAPDGESFVAHSGAKMSEWVGRQIFGVVIHEIKVYS